MMFLHGCQEPAKKNIMCGAPKGWMLEKIHWAQQWHKVLRCKTKAMSGKWEDTVWSSWTNSRDRDCEANSADFHTVLGTEWQDIVEGSAPSEVKEETSKAQPSEITKMMSGPTCTLLGNWPQTWQYTCRPIRTDSLKEEATWHADPQLGDDCKTHIQQLLLSNGSQTDSATATIGYNNNELCQHTWAQ